LGEGQGDQEAILTLCQRMSIDVRRRNIMVADCGSRDNLPDYIWFCAQLGLPYLAIQDADAGNKNASQKSQDVRDAFQRYGGGDLFEFPVHMEKTFGVRKHSGRTPDIIRKLSFPDGMPDSAQAPTKVVELAEAIRRLAA